ncbi:hypothetical protein AQUCO_00200901v1 [Aquilegia coerulea]|uniref:GIR1-like zinc ribbon domain-containing protein n=1 Tax=Aquilegia coerulea TaxID=218851 RepID=A0A2G5F5A3_AQUCA|nr:hypothetical protein AQUCO_00200901v1 [Aquilegia coerulea]
MASHLQQGRAGGDAARPGYPYFHQAQNPALARISSLAVNLDASERLPKGFSKFLDMKTGVVYYLKNGENDDTLRRNGRRHPVFESRHPHGGSASQSEISSLTSPPNSHVSSQNYPEEVSSCSNARDRGIASMTLMGCPRCHTYAMTVMGDESVMCPKCEICLIDFIREKSTN